MAETTADLTATADALRGHERFLVVTHENPDGDALGSLLAMQLTLRALGKDAVMYLAGDAPLPTEYEFMPLGDLARTLPVDASGRVLVAVDCAKAERIGDPQAIGRAPVVVNIDHHHDNTRFGDVNLVVPDASSTGEVLRDVVAELGLALTPDLAEPLYIALVTDTGRFQYANTTPKALRLAAELVEAGADIHAVFQQFGTQRFQPTLQRKFRSAVAASAGQSAITRDGRNTNDRTFPFNQTWQGIFGAINGTEEIYVQQLLNNVRA